MIAEFGQQKEVSSGRFCRAQIVSGRQTFPPIFWLGAGILPRRGDFNARHSPIVRLYFYQAPIFCVSAYILYTRLNFHETPEFWASARIFMRRWNFEHSPEFSWNAGILSIRQNFHETPEFWASARIFMWRQYFMYLLIFWAGANILWFCLILLLRIFVYIFSIYYAFKYAPIFLAQLFWP